MLEICVNGSSVGEHIVAEVQKNSGNPLLQLPWWTCCYQRVEAAMPLVALLGQGNTYALRPSVSLTYLFLLYYHGRPATPRRSLVFLLANLLLFPHFLTDLIFRENPGHIILLHHPLEQVLSRYSSRTHLHRINFASCFSAWSARPLTVDMEEISPVGDAKEPSMGTTKITRPTINGSRYSMLTTIILCRFFFLR